MIETIAELPENVVGFEAVGEVSADDYREVLVPAVATALEDGDRIRLLYVLGERFEGMSPGAMWEDAKLGFEHLRAWERMSVVTDVDWIGHAIRAFAWTIPAEVRIFPVADRAAAEAWSRLAVHSVDAPHRCRARRSGGRESNSHHQLGRLRLYH